jgi:acetolactate synthase-1/2/3 large subunit
VSAPTTRQPQPSQPLNGTLAKPKTPAPPKHVAPQQLTGAQSVIRSLEELDVDVIFGIPGGAVLPVYDPLFDSKKLRHVLVRHEQGAGHAASGYAHATGKVGVCMATSGPGATNLVTPLADAQMDSIPVVAVTGQVGRSLIGTDAFQEADISGITMPITKHNFLVRNGDEIPRVLAQAFHIASSGRPGALLVDIPKAPGRRTWTCPATSRTPSRTTVRFTRPPN